MEMTDYEYQILTDSWEGAYRAVYNAAFEFCREFGWCTAKGELTELGRQAVSRYESKIN